MKYFSRSCIPIGIGRKMTEFKWPIHIVNWVFIRAVFREPPRGARDLRKFQFDSTEFSFRQSRIKVLSALVENRHREGLDSCMEALVLSYYNSYRPDGSDSIEKITFPSADREFDSVYYCSNRPNLSKPKNYNFKYQSFKPLQRVSSTSSLNYKSLIMLHNLCGAFVS